MDSNSQSTDDRANVFLFGSPNFSLFLYKEIRLVKCQRMQYLSLSISHTVDSSDTDMLAGEAVIQVYQPQQC